MKTLNVKINQTMPNMLILGDIHGNLAAFDAAIDYANQNDLHIFSLGDVINYGTQSAEVFIKVKDLVDAGKMSMVAGNHEYKIYRHLNAIMTTGKSNVNIESKHVSTLDGFRRLGVDIRDFVDFAAKIPNIQVFRDLNNITHVFTHAAIHKAFWRTLDGDTMNMGDNKIILAYSYFGQTMKDQYDDCGRPLRIYDWVKHIPADTKVYVGHDIVDQVTVHDGKMVQMDTGSSKGGFLSGLCTKTNQLLSF